MADVFRALDELGQEEDWWPTWKTVIDKLSTMKRGEMLVYDDPFKRIIKSGLYAWSQDVEKAYSAARLRSDFPRLDPGQQFQLKRQVSDIAFRKTTAPDSIGFHPGPFWTAEQILEVCPAPK